MKIVVETMYSSDIVFFVNEKPEECYKLLKNKKDREMVKENFPLYDSGNQWCVFHYHDNGKPDYRRQFVFLGNYEHEPQFYGNVAHEIYHCVNNISHLVGLVDDLEGNEHLAYLIGYIHSEFFAGLLGFHRKTGTI